MEEQPGSKRDWSAYNSHRKKELGRFIRESKRALLTVGPPTPPKDFEGKPGRPPYDPSSMLLTNLLRLYLKMSYRDLEAFLRDNEQMRRKLGLPDAPGRDTIHRYAKTLSEEYLREFNASLTARVKRGDSASVSMPPVYRSSGTQSVGMLPNTQTAAKNS